ncbi:hypothetical protein [Kurthia massiliensis]|uniref:hypothetical protein n=1 Tax=Kurthia massiliensis TaxID=1033739 RepID=UPI000288DB4A|nr:hypothetical protein [Kurthia massiliensis]
MFIITNYSIEVELDSTTWISGTVPIELSSLSNSLSFNLLELLLHVADATKNPNFINFQINDYWAFLRYQNCFKAPGDIVLNELFEDVDSHQKTILSDDMGMGFTSLILDRAFGLKTLTDTSYFIKYLGSLSSNRTSKHGPNKTPDFIALDNSLDLHIVECKGTQTSLSQSNTQLEKGITQKNNLNDPYHIINQKLAIGTFLARYNSKESSRIKIVDPDFDLDFSEKDIKDSIIYYSLLSQFLKELKLYLPPNWLKKNVSSKNYEENLFEFLKQNLKEIPDKIDRDNYFEEFDIKKEFDTSLLNKKLLNANSLKEFILQFKDNSKIIKDGNYKGVFGLSIQLEYKK